MKIGLIGNGFVGRAVYENLKQNYNTSMYQITMMNLDLSSIIVDHLETMQLCTLSFKCKLIGSDQIVISD